MPKGAVAVALVEDDAFVSRGLKRALLAYGYRVEAFSSAEQYLEHGNPGEITCAVVDLHLGDGLSGLELGQAITRSKWATQVVFMTASDDPALRRRAMEIGCLEFLRKPFPISTLIAALTKLEGQDPQAAFSSS